MNSLQFLSHLIELYGLYAVFSLAMIEGDITLLLAGVLAHNDFFGSYSFARVLLWGTLGGFASDNVAGRHAPSTASRACAMCVFCRCLWLVASCGFSFSAELVTFSAAP